MCYIDIIEYYSAVWSMTVKKLNNIMWQKQVLVWFSYYEMSKMTDLWRLKVFSHWERGMGVTSNAHDLSFGDDENILNLYNGDRFIAL